jgi:tetratricopeptide (TPR) repeat protein
MNKKTPGKKSKKGPSQENLKPKVKPKVESKANLKAKSKLNVKARDKAITEDQLTDAFDAKFHGNKLSGSKEDPALGDVMASLSKIFGGQEFLSDAELESFLDGKIASGEIPPSAALDPLDEAQSLIYEAWNTEGQEKIHLARRALDISADCADAYVILAEKDAKTLPEALALYRKGLDAAKRAIGQNQFEGAIGHFWAIMETRPYMRAKLGLAQCLWELSQPAEALEHLWEMLRLNPSDNQGIRYVLIEYLLESGADQELGDLLEKYPDDASPELSYTRALWVYRREGRTKAASALLSKAFESNPHVPDFLLNRKKLPKNLPESATFGSPEEAATYVLGAIEPWHHTLGALEWLAGNLPAKPMTRDKNN